MPERPALAVLLLASSLTIMVATILTPALPPMLDHFADHPSAAVLIPLVLTIPGLAVAVSAPLAGLLADKWGRVRILVGGLVLYAFAGASALVLQSLEAIIAGRIVLGIAAGCTMTCATALIVDHWEGAARRRALGFQASALGFGGAVFPVIGGLLAEFGWRWPFAAYLCTIPLAALAAWALKDAPRVNAAREASGSRFPVSLALVVLFLAGAGMLILYAIPLRVPFYLRELGYHSTTLAALTVALPSLAAALAALNAGVLQSRVSHAGLVGLSFGVMALGYAIVGWSGSFIGLCIGMVACGIGFGINTPNLVAWLQSRTPVDMRGRAAGALTTAVCLGQFLATFVFAFLARATTAPGTFAAVATACLAIAAAGLIGALAISGFPHARAKAEQRARVPT
jgi:MFS family permease